MYKRILSTILTISILFNLVGCERKKFFDAKKDPHELEELVGYENLSKWILELNEIAPEFEYKDYYFNEEDLKDIYNNSRTTKECDNKENNTYKDLYKEIVKNNSNYGESPFSYINSVDSDESKIYANCSVALYGALQNIFEEKKDFYEDYCKLKDVVILMGSIDGNVTANYNSSDNLIIVDYKKMEKNYFVGNEVEFLEYLTETIEHEINHARQYSCDCRLEKGQNYYGINPILKDNDGNYYSFLKGLIEATAESEIYTDKITEMSYYDTSNFGYRKERENLSLLMLLGMFKKDFTKEKLYDAIYDSDLTKFYELYEIEDIKDLTTFYNILYALETRVGRTPLATHLEENEKSLDTTYKVYIFRETVKDLIKRIYSEEYDLEESITLYQYLKLYTIYDEQEIYKENKWFYDEEFMNNIKQIEKVFCSFLANYYVCNENYFDINERLGLLESLTDYREVYYLKDTSWSGALFINPLTKRYPIIFEIDYGYSVYTYSLEKFEHQYEKSLTRKLD